MDTVRETFTSGATPKEWWTPDPKKVSALIEALRKTPVGDLLIGRFELDLMIPVTETDAPLCTIIKI